MKHRRIGIVMASLALFIVASVGTQGAVFDLPFTAESNPCGSLGWKSDVDEKNAIGFCNELDEATTVINRVCADGRYLYFVVSTSSADFLMKNKAAANRIIEQYTDRWREIRSEKFVRITFVTPSYHTFAFARIGLKDNIVVIVRDSLAKRTDLTWCYSDAG